MALGVFLVAFGVSETPAGEPEGSISGLLYVSYPGDLSFDVMVANGVEVSLLKSHGALEKGVADLKEDRVAKIQAREAAAVKAHAEARRAVGKEKVKEKRDLLKRESDAFERLRSEYEKDVNVLVAKSTLKKTKTDSEGKFRFEGLAPGRYLLSARFEIRGTDSNYFWLYPVEVKPGAETEAQLSKNTATPLY
ncbi:MAG: carboxypeptidase regulatory-like domain-containing protein [Deltaproteobacteria bacterium]|nr:carboxypeptidase regulatory-like domain-containing protein [Deltaproteobacteria bacterium]